MTVKLSQAEKTSLYRKFVPMAHMLANRAARKYPHVLADDLHDEAESALGVFVADWERIAEPERYSTEMKMWFCLYYRLVDFVRREQPKYTTESDYRAGLSGDSKRDMFSERQEPESRCHAIARNLGGDALVLFKMIVHAPADIIEDMDPRAISWTKGAIRGRFRRKGWSPSRIDSAWKEVAAVVVRGKAEEEPEQKHIDCMRVLILACRGRFMGETAAVAL